MYFQVIGPWTQPDRMPTNETTSLRTRLLASLLVLLMLGALPLALGTGVGAELRRPLGMTIVGGLIMSQLLTLYTTPVVYLYLERLHGAVARVGSALAPRRWLGAHR